MLCCVWKWTTVKDTTKIGKREGQQQQQHQKGHNVLCSIFIISISGLLFDQIYSFQLEKFFV